MKLHTLSASILASAGNEPTQPVPSVATVRALAGRQAELRLYGLIGDFFWEGITADAIAAELDGLDVDTILVTINSRGGEVDHGTAIYNALKRHKARIVVRVDGQAGSIASVIAMAGDEVVMPPTAMLMIHAPYLLAGGNAQQMRNHAERLDATAEAMLEAYAAKTGDREGMRELLTDGADHWFTAERAVELGLADRVETFESQPDEAAAAAAMVGYLSAISHADGAVASALRGHIQAAAEPRLFALLPGDTQRQVIAHIEEPTMKQKLQSIYAAAAGGNAPAAPEPAAATAPSAPPVAPPAAATAPSVPAAVTADQVLAAQRDRNTEILAAARPHAGNQQIDALRDEALTNPAMSVADFNARALAILGQQAAPAAGGPRAEAGADERDNRVVAIAAAIDARLGHAQADNANPYRGMRMHEIARACAQAAGVAVRGMDPTDVVRAAITHTSSDFPRIVGDSVRRAVLRGYEEVPEVFDRFTRAISVPDFRKTSLAGLGQFVGVDIVREGGEYNYGTFADLGQEVKLEKSGALFSITDEAIINDDLNLFDAIPRKMGAGARRNLGDRVFALLTGNPTLADGVALFHANHNNLVSPGSALTTATVDGMRVLMATQKDSTGGTIRVPLKFLVVPVGMGGLARQVLESQFEIGATKANTAPNYVRNSFEVIEDPRLDANSAGAWYGIADPAVIDGIVVAYRDGVQTPRVTQKEGWNVDGIEFKVRLDAAPAIADHVGLAKNPGPA